MIRTTNINNNWRKTFYTVFIGQIASMLTSSIVGFSIILWLSLKTGSSTVLSTAMICNIAPGILFGLFAGVYVDRWDKRKTLIFSDLFVSLCTLFFLTYFYLGGVNILVIYMLLIPRSIGNAFYYPTLQSSIPLFVPEQKLMQIAGANQIAGSICNMVGPVIAAFLIELIDLKFILLLDVIGAIIACTSLLFVQIESNEILVPKKTFIKEIMEGINVIITNINVKRMFFLNLLIVFFMLPLVTLFPLLTMNFFNCSVSEVSLVQLFWCLGIMFGGFMLGIKYIRKEKRSRIIIFMSFIVGISFLISGILPAKGFYTFVLLVMVSGIGYSISNCSFLVLMQTQISKSKMGRVLSLSNVLLMIPSIPSLFITALIGDYIKVNYIFLSSGLAILLCGGIFFLIEKYDRKN
ncbi:MFS transporter [Bacteroides ovatus]|uniref:MFS transporter n=1 Tax=Bacteroides ovatus TaxID=28116 RepID=UPI000E4FE88B|nr:MFS transporter [Bacteroides ovatus]RGR15255.1 MFS transporter [Bacteroides ovatus]